MARRLTRTVHGLRDPQTGAARSFGPGDRVPGWAAEQITNPSAWTEGPDSSVQADGPSDEDLAAQFEAGYQAGREGVLDELCGIAGVDTDEQLREVLEAGVAALTDPGPGSAASEPAEPPAVPPTVERPPLGGAGSGRDAWAAYAVSQGCDPAEAEMATREDLIDRYGD